MGLYNYFEFDVLKVPIDKSNASMSRCAYLVIIWHVIIYFPNDFGMSDEQKYKFDIIFYK